jgi:protein-S-isoprenylcysteine O-methyltransferase Ste14
MGVTVVAGVAGPRWPGGAHPVLVAIGAVLAVTGLLLAVFAARTLGRSLTPFPRPAAAGELIDRGAYGLVRHPVYTGGILFFVGFSLWAGPAALALTAVLSVLWALKSRVEERHLTARYPGYAAYCGRVRWRLLPFL